MPLSASTAIPESSATAGKPVYRTASRALSSALSAKVAPVSGASGYSGTSRSPTTSTPGTASASSRCSSTSFPALRVASSSRVLTAPRQRLLLQPGELAAAGDGEVEQRVEGRPVEHRALRRPLHLDEAAVAGADDVHVGAGADVLLVGEVQPRFAVDDADADRGDAVHDRIRLGQLAALAEPAERVGQGDVGPGDGRRAGAAVGLEDVAVEGDAVLAQRPRSIAARRERPISRLISCVRPPIRPFTDSRSLRVWVARGSIAYSAVTQPRPEPLRQRGTPSVTLAAQSTRVRPNSTSTEPSAWSSQLRVMVTGRS